MHQSNSPHAYNLEAARWLASCGLLVFPCDPISKKPAHGLSSPALASTNIDRGVLNLWDRYGFNCMVGLPMKANGLAGVDLDRKHGKDGTVWFDQELATRGIVELPRYASTKTRSGGYHLIGKQPAVVPDMRNTAGKLGPGVDTRGGSGVNGGHLIAPGSVTLDGEFYESVPGYPELGEAFKSGALDEAWPWLIEMTLPSSNEIDGGPPLGPRPEATDEVSEWAMKALEGEAVALAGLGEGSRNDQLYRQVCKFAGHVANGWLEYDDVHAAMLWAFKQNGYLDSTDPSDGPVQFNKTFNGAWKWGFARPTRGPSRAGAEFKINISR